MTKPMRGIVIGPVSPDFKDTQAKMDIFTRTIRESHPDHQMAWNTEPYPVGNLFHIHGWQRSRHLHHDVLYAAARKAGLDGIFAETIKAQGRAITYSLKTVTALPTYPEDEAREMLDAFLAANGGRQLIHSTQGFWITATGQPTTLRRAISAYYRSLRRARELSRAA